MRKALCQRAGALRRRDAVWCSVVVVVGLGCAQGAAAPSDSYGIGLETLDAAISAMPPPADAGAKPMTMTGMTMPPKFTGVACKMGDTMPCTCTDGVSMGTQSCRFDATSPTMGALGMCERCKAPPMPDAGMMNEAGSGDSGSGGSAGSSNAGSGGSGASGSGSAGSMSAGSGGSMSGGSGGSGGSAAMCVADKCPDPGRDLLGVPLRKCCTRRGQCGGQSLLGGCNAN